MASEVEALTSILNNINV